MPYVLKEKDKIQILRKKDGRTFVVYIKEVPVSLRTLLINFSPNKTTTFLVNKITNKQFKILKVWPWIEEEKGYGEEIDFQKQMQEEREEKEISTA